MIERSKLSVAVSVAILWAGLMGVGCEKSDTTPPASSGSSTPAAPKVDTSAAAAPAAEGAKAAGESAAEGAKAASDTAGAAAEGAKADAGAASEAGAAAASDATAQATDLLKQVATYVKENKMDLAEKALKQLDSLKGQLPAEYHSKIDAARTMVETAKKGEGLKGLLPK